MYSINNRDELEKLKSLQETKFSLKVEKLKEHLAKQDFQYDMEEVFELVTESQKQSKLNNENILKNEKKRHMNPLKLQHKQKKARLKQYKNLVTL